MRKIACNSNYIYGKTCNFGKNATNSESNSTLHFPCIKIKPTLRPRNINLITRSFTRLVADK